MVVTGPRHRTLRIAQWKKSPLGRPAAPATQDTEGLPRRRPSRCRISIPLLKLGESHYTLSCYPGTAGTRRASSFSCSHSFHLRLFIVLECKPREITRTGNRNHPRVLLRCDHGRDGRSPRLRCRWVGNATASRHLGGGKVVGSCSCATETLLLEAWNRPSKLLWPKLPSRPNGVSEKVTALRS